MTNNAPTMDAASASLLPANEAERTPAWAAVLSLTVGVFGLVTAEFLPASLLTPIAADLGISVGTAGQAVTATAVVAAVAGPAIVIGTGAIDRRMIVWGLTALLVLSNVLAAVASNVWILLIARATLGIALGGVWSLAGALALRLVPPHLLPRAMTLIFTGVSAATVCAPALGAYLGDLWGWRSAFIMAGGIGMVALLIQLITLPRLPATDSPGLSTFAMLLRRPRILVGLVTIIFMISGHFAGFTYMRAFLEQIARLDVHMLSLVLLAFGVAGFFGNLAGGAITDRSPRMGVVLGALLMAATAFVMVAYGASVPVAIAATATWGFAFGAIPVSIQTWNAQAASDHAESAGALLVTTFQIAIALGAIIGGVLVDMMGTLGAIGYGGIAALVGGVIMLAFARGVPRAV